MNDSTDLRPLPLAVTILAAGLTPSEFAEAIGVGRSVVSKWTHPERHLLMRPTPQTWLRMIEVLTLGDDSTRRLARWFEERYQRGVDK